ncbi:MAG: winged helix-turn-helix domain-containing protein [Candidatus Peregrinibacteria bacterium]|nr:winged helix-turn-helix domain-containing protein [Candidatus Peregrinibacteria bacterium]
MFSKLIKSEARKAILQLFTQNGRQKYYLRELASKINYSPGSLQRELNSLVESGLVLSEKMGNLRFFFLNQKCPLLKELKLYLSQHTATKQDMESPKMPQKITKSPSQPKKARPVLEQNILKNPPPIHAEKHERIEDIADMPIQPNTQATTHVDTHIPTQTPASAELPSIELPPQEALRPVTPYSHIEPPTFSKPVLHKPYFEKPRIAPLTSEPTYTFTTFQPIEPEVVFEQPPTRNFDIIINSPVPDGKGEPPVSGSTDIEIHIE